MSVINQFKLSCVNKHSESGKTKGIFKKTQLTKIPFLSSSPSISKLSHNNRRGKTNIDSSTQSSTKVSIKSEIKKSIPPADYKKSIVLNSPRYNNKQLIEQMKLKISRKEKLLHIELNNFTKLQYKINYYKQYINELQFKLNKLIGSTTSNSNEINMKECEIKTINLMIDNNNNENCLMCDNNEFFGETSQNKSCNNSMIIEQVEKELREFQENEMRTYHENLDKIYNAITEIKQNHNENCTNSKEIDECLKNVTDEIILNLETSHGINIKSILIKLTTILINSQVNSSNFELHLNNHQNDAVDNYNNDYQHKLIELNKQLELKDNDILQKDNLIKELQNNLNMHELQFNDQSQKITELNMQLVENYNTQQKIDNLINNIENLQNEKLEIDKKLHYAQGIINRFDEIRNKIENPMIIGAGENVVQIINQNLSNNHWSDMDLLKIDYYNLINEKQSLEREQLDFVKHCDELQSEKLMANEELKKSLQLNETLQENLSKLEQFINNKFAGIQINAILNNSLPMQENESKKLIYLNAEQLHQIEHLNAELIKLQEHIKEQDETVYMHQRLLKIRSELISTMQEKEDSAKNQIECLYADVNRKTEILNNLNNEISVKAEELQNIFSTLGMKQLELNRQEHIIHMLQQHNDRNQIVRVRLEEKIAKLERENYNFKNN